MISKKNYIKSTGKLPTYWIIHMTDIHYSSTNLSILYFKLNFKLNFKFKIN